MGVGESTVASRSPLVWSRVSIGYTREDCGGEGWDIGIGELWRSDSEYPILQNRTMLARAPRTGNGCQRTGYLTMAVQHDGYALLSRLGGGGCQCLYTPPYSFENPAPTHAIGMG